VTPSYEAWNAALAGRFLQGHRDHPLYLYTDESVLEEVAAVVGVDPAAALTEFVSAVRETLGQDEPFRRWVLQARRGGPVGTVPSWLGVLCFLVLVAVERDSTRFQYYPELNGHLGRPGEARAPSGFDVHVPALFQRFNEWLLDEGSVHGLPTARSHEHFPNIGWPLSQAIVRPVDRALLVRLFASEHLDPEQDRSGGWLRAKLVPRLRTLAASPSRTRLLDLNDHHSEVLEDVLSQEYRAWDGAPVIVLGPRRVRVRLCLDETRGEWWLLAPRVDGTERQRWSLGSASGIVPAFKGAEVVLPDDELWRVLGAGDVGQIENGPILASPRVRLRWMSLDTRAGAWAEVGRRDAGQDQMLLVDEVGAQALSDIGGVSARRDAPPGQVLLFVPAGTCVFEEELPPKSSRPLLSGGLCLNRSTVTYLLTPTGLPVIAPASVARIAGEQLQVRDGVAVLAAAGLGEGEHSAEVDGHRVRFRLVERLQQGPVEAGTASWVSHLPVVPRLRLPHDGGSIWLVGERGQLEERPGTAATWLADLGLMANEVDVTSMVRSTWFEPAFVVSNSFRGKPWVEPVPPGLGKAQASELPRALNRSAARDLVSKLLVGYSPAARAADASWKRAFAALMRTAHA
jgi:hypothetical protein